MNNKIIYIRSLRITKIFQANKLNFKLNFSIVVGPDAYYLLNLGYSEKEEGQLIKSTITKHEYFKHLKFIYDLFTYLDPNKNI